MNIFYTDFCPVCHAKFNKYGIGTNDILYDCSENYLYGLCHYTFACYNLYSNQNYVRLLIPNFKLVFNVDVKNTHIWKIDGDGYEFIIAFQGYFPVNWDNLNETSSRIQSLLVFL